MRRLRAPSFARLGQRALQRRCLSDKSALGEEGRQVALLGICEDRQSSYLRGPAKAPPLLRKALYSDSANPCAEWMGCNAHDAIAHDFGDLHEPTHEEIEQAMAAIFEQGHKPLTFGGDHSISFPLLKAVAKLRGNTSKPLCVIHFDAHTDLYQSFEGNDFSHACPFTRIMENGLAHKLIQVGLRTITPHHREQMERFDVKAIEMMQYPDRRVRLQHFFSRHVPHDADVYVSFDLDALDPAFAPGVSHHEPGGMSTRQALDCIQRIPGGTSIIGCDVVEYNPERDINGVTSMVGAKIAKELIAKMHSNPLVHAEVWLRGLPFTAGRREVLHFLAEHADQVNDVEITNRGEAKVVFESQRAAEQAIMSHNFKNLDDRYVEMVIADNGDL
eukprot:TRINITY_DN38120_c0_g1_i1.p1 TRINITY_DN38120_c0_g1~~TRINITY_DN38120_c0_g1_i1.p1  ORF type:complete len:388 (-),score=63.87 TRINITY_DN38120_c0_g1_i1:325-1488(-)